MTSNCIYCLINNYYYYYYYYYYYFIICINLRDVNEYERSMALPVKEFSLDSPEQFLSVIYPSREPCILRGVDIGPAPSLWTADYLSQICGHDHNVKVHVCPQSHMDFIGKNFMYRYRKNDSIILASSL